MVFMKVVFTLDYRRGHSLYIDAIAYFYAKRPRVYMLENAKTVLLQRLDFTFNPTVTDQMYYMGIQRIRKREGLASGLEDVVYPNIKIEIIYTHHKGEAPQYIEEVARV